MTVKMVVPIAGNLVPMAGVRGEEEAVLMVIERRGG
jgi:hypothetical protein